jgi:hypothetical protein
LAIDPMLCWPFRAAAQSFEPISWHCRHVLQHFGVVQHAELSPRHGGDVAEFTVFAVNGSR